MLDGCGRPMIVLAYALFHSKRFGTWVVAYGGGFATFPQEAAFARHAFRAYTSDGCSTRRMCPVSTVAGPFGAGSSSRPAPGRRQCSRPFWHQQSQQLVISTSFSALAQFVSQDFLRGVGIPEGCELQNQTLLAVF